tara:strand:+ start:362 stop:562 length:201 start_codon:yes stop_codon:yes gene_type:complete
VKRKEMKQGQLVKLANDSQRWSGFVDLNRIGIVLSHDEKAIAQILFTDGKLEEHWFSSLESVNESW